MWNFCTCFLSGHISSRGHREYKPGVMLLCVSVRFCTNVCNLAKPKLFWKWWFLATDIRMSKPQVFFFLVFKIALIWLFGRSMQFFFFVSPKSSLMTFCCVWLWGGCALPWQSTYSAVAHLNVSYDVIWCCVSCRLSCFTKTTTFR